jgi:hypothetical protein
MAVCFVTVLQRGVDKHSPFWAVTQTCPLVNDDEKLTMMECVPCPETTEAPEGAVQ